MRVIVSCLGVLAVFFSMAGCGRDMNREMAIEQLLETDRTFSHLSVERGTLEAFTRYAAEEAVIFRDRRHPITGVEAVRKLFQGSGGTLRWEPYFADLAESGEMGYTLGTYDYTYSDETGEERHSYGYYVSIWKRQRGGSWKYVFDSGIEAPDSTGLSG